MDVVIGVMIGVCFSTVVASGIQRKMRESGEAQQKLAIEQVREELVNSHQAELKTTMDSLRREHEQKMNQKIEEMQHQHQNQLHDRIISVQGEEKQKSDRQITQLKQEYESKIASLEKSYEALQSKYEEGRVQQQTLQEEVLLMTQKVKTTVSPTLSTPIVVESEDALSIPELLELAVLEDVGVRMKVAILLGEQAASGTAKGEILQAIPMLGALSQDKAKDVRLAAIASLGQIPSGEVIPYLEKGLKDSDLDVVQTATQAIQAYKFYPSSAPKASKPLPKNAAAMDEV